MADVATAEPKAATGKKWYVVHTYSGYEQKAKAALEERVRGHSTMPPEVPESEVRAIAQQMEEGALRPKPKVLFEVGEAVKVVDGPFQDFNGTVEEVRPEKGKVRVLISIFGRATPVELDFVQVEKS